MTIANIQTAIANLTTVFGDAIGIITGSVPMMLFLAGGVVMLGFRIFKRGRRAVR